MSRTSGKAGITEVILRILREGSQFKTNLTSQQCMNMRYGRSWNKQNFSLIALFLFCAGLSSIGVMSLASAAPSVTISPTSGPPGSTITIVGSGFTNDTRTAVLLDYALLLETRTDGSGTFTMTAEIPTSAGAGDHKITIADIPESTHAIFTVTPPTLLASPNTGGPGTIVTLSGSSFGANKAMTIKFDSVDLSAPANLLSSSIGIFSTAISIPSNASTGAHTISVTDGTLTVSSIFAIPEASITLSSPSSGPGAVVTVTGAGFFANSPVTVKFDSTILATAPTAMITSPSGTFSSAITIPGVMTSSIDVITVTDASGRTASAVINVIAPARVTLSKTVGITGSAVTISGFNFSPKSPVTIKFDSTTLTTASEQLATNSAGTFDAAITIPDDASVGSHTIFVIDTSGKITSALLVVTTPGIITISPPTGPPGTELVITGSNFVNSTELSIKLDDISVIPYPPHVVSSLAGKFLAKFLVPANLTQGTYIISVDDGNGKTGTAIYTVLGEGLYASLAPSSNEWIIKVAGVGFAPNTVIKVNFDGDTVVTDPTKITTTIAGTFTASFTAPGTAPNGNHTISATGNDKAYTTTVSLKRQYLDDRYGVLISVVPQKYNFDPGETVVITGKVLALKDKAPLLLKVLNPNNAACSFQQLSLDQDMDFNGDPVKLAGPLCSIKGEYKITAFYAGGKALTKFKVAGSDPELTGGKAEVINGENVRGILRYDNKYPVDLEWASNAVLIRNNLNQTVTFYLMFAEFDANEITKKLSYQGVTLGPFDKDYVVAPYVPAIIDGKPNGYLHVFVWTALDAPKPLHPGLYVPY